MASPRTVGLIIIGLVLGTVVAGAALNLAGSDGVEISDGVPISSPNNNTVTVHGDTNISLEEFAPTSDTVDIVTEDGNMTVQSGGNTHVGVVASDITGSKTKLLDIIAGGTEITVNPEDKNEISFQGDLTELHWQDIDTSTRQEDIYISGPDGGTGTVTYDYFSPDTSLAAYDIDTGNLLDSATSDASGTASFDIPLSTHSVSIETFDSSDPTLSNFEPADGTTIRWSNETIGVDVDDSDFESGDEVEVEIYVDGTLESTQNITSAQRVSTSVSGLSEGDHTYHIEARDSYGGETISDTRTFTVDHYAPSATANSPEGTVRYSSNTLEADVSDADFDLDGDQLTVEFILDGSVVDTQTVNSNSTVTYDTAALADGSHEWYVTVTDSYGQSTTSDTLTYTIDHFEPQVTTLQLTGLLDYNPSEVSADINDTDFAYDGDSLTVDIYIDDSLVDTQTISANATVATSIPSSGLTGGDHTYRFEVTDDYGQSTTESASYSIPAELTIRNELDHTEIISDPINSTITFFGDDATYQRETSNGVINMTGLPVNQEFVVTVDPSDANWTSRTVYVSDIYEQQAVYLLNMSATDVVTNRFVLDDATGQYDSSSVVKVQRTINVSGEQVWRTVHADQFGTEGVTMTLEEGVRHRVLVRNEDGQEQVVGPYRAEQTEQVAVQPSSANIELPTPTDGPVANATLNGDAQEIEWALSSGVELDEVTVSIYEKGNESNQIFSQTYYNVKTISDVISIDENQTNKAWVVDWQISNDGESSTITREVGSRPVLLDDLGDNWQAIIGVSLLFLLAGAFSILNAAIGAVVVSLIGGLFWWIGLFGGVTSGIAIALALLVSLAGYIASKGP